MNKLLALILFSSGSHHCVAQPKAAPLPLNYTTVLKNDSFQVIRVHYGPHEKVPVHDHPDVPTVYVYLNDSGPVKIVHDEATAFTLIRPPTHTGAFRVSRGRLERHSIENLSDLPSDFLRVELPTLHLGERDLEFRGPAPKDLTHNLSAAEFSSPHLKVVRILCVDPKPCPVPPTSSPSVVVALSPTTVSHNGQATKLEPGGVVPATPQQTLAISPTGTEPAHILQVIVQTATP